MLIQKPRLNTPYSLPDIQEVDHFSTRVFEKLNIPTKLLSFCKISIQCENKDNKFFIIKFPKDSAYGDLSDYSKFYFNETKSIFADCSIEECIFGNEALFHGDYSYKNNKIKYSGFSSKANGKVVFTRRKPSGTSLIVLVKNGTYIIGGNRIALNRRGSHVLYGLQTKITEYDNINYQLTVPCPKLKIKSPTSFILYREVGSAFSCLYQSACYEFLCSQGFDFQYFDGFGNRCYCASCFPNNWINSETIANEKYIIPRGWCRFGLKVPNFCAEINNIWKTWCNVFHGTSPSAAKSIIEHKTLLLHGDYTKAGVRIGIKCSFEEYGYYYTSPHICYSSHPWYSDIITLPKINGEKRYAQVAFAIKIRHGCYTKQNETEGGAKKIFDDYTIIPEHEIEWYSKRRGCVFPYGVLVRIFGDNEKKIIERLSFKRKLNK